MRKYVKKQRVVNDKVLIETTCDLCGKIAKSGQWNSSTYEVNEVEIEVTVRQKDGSAYPEGGCGAEFIVDMCPECFKLKLIPWLKENGATVKEKEWYW